MSFDKAIEHHKEHRKEYIRSRKNTKSFDKTCRCHGSCLRCEGDRRYREFRLEEKYKYDIKDYEDDTDTEVYDPESDYDDRI